MPDGSYSLFDRIDGRIARKKFEKALEMLRSESPQELRRKIGNIDKDEILAKMNEYSPARLRQMGINIDEMKGSITERDLQKLLQVLGPDGAIIVQRIRQMLN
jgi:hypothetical protein